MAINLIGRLYDWVYQTTQSAGVYVNTGGVISSTNLSGSNSEYRDKNGVYRHGSPWYLHKRTKEVRLSDNIRVIRPGFTQEGVPAYVGACIARDPPPPAPIILDDLEAYGPELYASAKPDKPYMDLGNAFYELRELPDMLRQRFTKDLMGASNYWLALKFGWEPLLKDIRKFVFDHRALQKHVNQLLKDNGRPVRRSRVAKHLGDDTRTITGASSGIPDWHAPVLVTQCYKGPTTTVYETSYSRKVWFSGQFRYWLPEMGSMTETQWKRKVLARVYGLWPTPRTIYKAIPWSWLVDWFSNVGSNVDNLNANVADRLICDYAFVMRQTDISNSATTTGSFWSDGNRVVDAESTVSIHDAYKERVGASPFGFRVKNDSLSDYQVSILSALAGSRGGSRGVRTST